jgi:hypothetical protein
VEGLLALAGARWSVLSGVVLVGAPGLALQPLLPRELGTLGRWLVVPLVGSAVASIVVISASAVGVPLTGTSIRLLLALVAVAGVAATRLPAVRAAGGTEPGTEPSSGRERSRLAVVLGLAAILCVAVALQDRVIGGSPVPGTDWGHYLLYPDEIARQHSLSIENPYWMLGGEPFRDDPGAAALYGSFLLMSGADTAVLVHGIWLFALLAIVSVFVLASSLWGPAAGLAAAGLYAVIPMNETMLGWHGLSNLYGLALLPLSVLAMGWLLRGRADARWSGLLALVLVALAAAHRLTFVVACLALGLTALAALASSADRRRLLAFGLRTAAFVVPLGALVAVDLIRRSHEAGGVQSYKVYLVTKVDLGLTASDLTVPVTVLGVLAMVALASRVRTDRALLAVYGLALAVAMLAYGWLLHLPTVYYRLVYFLPLVMATAIGVALAGLPDMTAALTRARLTVTAVAASAAVVLVGATAVVAHDRAPTVRSFYDWASDASLKGLADVQQRTGPRDAVVTDRCWGFLTPWLVRRPVLAGIDPADILPAWEAKPAATARRILYGPPAEAQRLAAANRARYAIVNPGCASDETNELRMPAIGRPIYESTRLVVVDLRAR